MTGTVAISWGPSGGFYLHRDFSWRVCLWRFALTYCPVELDDMMEAYAERGAWTAQRTPAALPLSGVSARMARRPAGLGHDCGGRS